jgi:hypothetical protein
MLEGSNVNLHGWKTDLAASIMALANAGLVHAPPYLEQPLSQHGAEAKYARTEQ